MTEQSVKDDLEVVVNLASEGGERTILGEGPWWDLKKQVLYFIDIRGLKVHEYSPKSKTTKTVNLTQKPGCGESIRNEIITKSLILFSTILIYMNFNSFLVGFFD